jgi:hypothetical protein
MKLHICILISLHVTRVRISGMVHVNVASLQLASLRLHNFACSLLLLCGCNLGMSRAILVKVGAKVGSTGAMVPPADVLQTA